MTSEQFLIKIAIAFNEKLTSDRGAVYSEAMLRCTDQDANRIAYAHLIATSDRFPAIKLILDAYHDAQRSTERQAIGSDDEYRPLTDEERIEGARFFREIAAGYGKDGILKSF